MATEARMATITDPMEHVVFQVVAMGTMDLLSQILHHLVVQIVQADDLVAVGYSIDPGLTPVHRLLIVHLLLNLGSSTRLYGMHLMAALCNGAVRGQPVDSHTIICHTSVTCECHSYVCIYTTLGV